MFYRVSTYEYPEDRQAEIETWAHTKTELVRRIDGLIAVDVFEAVPGEGVIVASYEDEAAFSGGSATVKSVLGDMAQFLTAAPVTASGTPFWTTRN